MFTRGDIKVRIYDFDSKKELYFGLSKRGNDFYLHVDRLEWVRKEHKLKV